jgi:shikimate kinase
VGKLVANALQYCFFDTDDIIEQLAGKAVSEIFAEDGEASFRDLETQVIKVGWPVGHQGRRGRT